VTGAKAPKLLAIDARDQEMENWLRKHAAPAYDGYRADPSRKMSLEEVRTSIGRR
jgi:hypothetical protein